MARANPLPLPSKFHDVEDYIQSLLSFTSTSELFQRLCGGVHILDFFVQDPDLYSSLLPQAWRDWFHKHDISNILDLLLEENLGCFGTARTSQEQPASFNGSPSWRGGPTPPSTLIQYVEAIRSHSLERTFERNVSNGGGSAIGNTPRLSHHVSCGMKPKKIHEVENFAKYISDLTFDIALTSSYNVTHIVDFGSGQNYLGRALASPPYNKNVVAIESKQLNIKGAMSMDVIAKLARKEVFMRDKKQYRNWTAEKETQMEYSNRNNTLTEASDVPSQPRTQSTSSTGKVNKTHGEIQYIESTIQDGDLSNITSSVKSGPQSSQPRPQLMVISLHSCGNLLHHGLRSIALNPDVKAVAMVGCCYNLMTERLGPPTYKLPNLRFQTPRLDRTSCIGDPHGFPMSERFASYKHAHGEGVRFNITARMMAVQAPQNWTDAESGSFFTRHFYRALLQRIFLDRGVLGALSGNTDLPTYKGGQEGIGSGQPIIIGSLRKACYNSFIAYVRGAILKLSTDEHLGGKIIACMAGLTDDAISGYENKYKERKKELSAVWSLMAFSAGVVESTIVVDRWLYLREQKDIKDCWVDAVFEYKHSPRNLVVVGIKR